MQLARQSRDDRDHVAFARTLVRRRTDLIGLPGHRSDYRNSIRRRFAVDQTAAGGHSASSPAKPASESAPIRRPAFQARRIPMRRRGARPAGWNWKQEPAILARASEDDRERLHIERQGPFG